MDRRSDLSSDQLTVIAPDRRRHAEAAIDLLAKVFSDMYGYYAMRDWCRDVYVLPAHYDWRASRIGLIGERIVTHYGVWDFRMRIGSARVKVGGIGGVATDNDYRKRGLMDRTARASVEAMRAQGYDMSLLFGIGDFYHRYGYVRAWSEAAFVANVWDLPREAPAARIVRFAPRPQTDLAALYNQCYAATTGTAVRPTYTKRNNPWFEQPIGYKWNRDGKLAGYVLLNRRGAQIVCGEYCGDAEETLRVLGMLGRRWNCREVRFESLPYGCDLVKKLRWGTSRMEVHHHRSGGPLAALLNLPSALRKMEGELSRRVRRSWLADWRGDLLIADGRDEATLSIESGRVRVGDPGSTRDAIRGGDEVVQLLIGTDNPREVLEAARMRVTGDAARLAETLFPEQAPQMSHADRF